MTTMLEELRPLQFICLPILMFFRVSAPNENKGKSKLLWAHGKKEHGLYFFEVDEMREETLHFKALCFTDTLLW